MYADGICLMAPSAIGLQIMFDVCLNFRLKNVFTLFIYLFINNIYKARHSQLNLL